MRTRGWSSPDRNWSNRPVLDGPEDWIPHPMDLSATRSPVVMTAAGLVWIGSGGSPAYMICRGMVEIYWEPSLQRSRKKHDKGLGKKKLWSIYLKLEESFGIKSQKVGLRSIRREGPTIWYNLSGGTFYSTYILSIPMEENWIGRWLYSISIISKQSHSGNSMDEAESLSSLHLTLDVPGNRSQRSPKTCHLATRLRCEARHHDEIRVPDDVAGAEPLDLGRKMETGDKHGQTLQVIVKKMSKAFKSNYTHHLINVGLHIETVVLQATRERETRVRSPCLLRPFKVPNATCAIHRSWFRGILCGALELQSSFCHLCGRSAITTCQDECNIVPCFDASMDATASISVKYGQTTSKV